MSRLKKILLGFGILIVVLAASFLLVVGPWPVYASTGYENAGYYEKALEDIQANVAESTLTEKPGTLRAGWASRIITPKIGTPMAGYSARPGDKASEGVRDELYVKALALDDGVDTVVLVGADMLIIPPNLAELVREKVAAKSPLTTNDLLFGASHTHCGPGAFGPGIAAKISAGTYDPAIPEFLATNFADAILEAYQKREPAKLAHGSVDAPDYIRNRTRDAGVDSELSFLVVEQEDQDRCYLTSYSAHPTNFGSRMMEFSAEYPGELMRHIERATKATALYLGGALGSMGPKAPDAPNASAKVEAMGQALAQLVLDNTQNLRFETNLDVASLSIPIGMPAKQMRPSSPGWRLSPILARIFGVPSEGWLQGARVGEILFVGVPFDFSGETSADWKAWAATKDYDLWTTSFASTYCGYLSPDKYYTKLEDDGRLDYEIGLMNWFGPDTEAYYTSLLHHMADAMDSAPKEAA